MQWIGEGHAIFRKSSEVAMVYEMAFDIVFALLGGGAKSITMWFRSDVRVSTLILI